MKLRPGAILGNLAAVLFGITVALLIAEGALRATGYLPYATMPDSTVGIRWRPGAHYRQQHEGFSEGVINSQGWRDSEHALRKPPGTTRILFLGDSFVQAIEVPLDSAFTRRLERDLDRRAPAGHHVEVLAMGRAGMGTTEELLAYDRWGRRYDPDVVALLFIDNDWSDNWKWPGSDELRPYLVPDGDSLRLDDGFVRTDHFRRMTRLADLKASSSLVTTLLSSLQNLRVRVRPTRSEAGLVEEKGWYNVWNFDRSPPADSVPQMQLTARILTRLAHEVQAAGRKFVVFVPATAENAQVELLDARANDPNFDPGKVDRFLGALGAREGFDVVSMTAAYRAACAAHEPQLWYGGRPAYGHWNPRGHALAARLMADWFSAHAPLAPADSAGVSPRRAGSAPTERGGP